MENRLQIIYGAASSLFINRGYMRTQMKDIAKEIGLSTGMLYVYFKGKKDILDFILKCTITPDFIQQDFQYPIDEQLFEGLSNEIIAVLEESHAKFNKPLLNKANGYSFEQMISDAFDTISRYGTGCLVLEKNISDVGKLGDFYQKYRKEFFDDILRYVNIYLSNGEMRVVKYPELTAQQMIETLAWWGMHVQNDAFETQKHIPISVAKEICMDNILYAYKK